MVHYCSICYNFTKVIQDNQQRCQSTDCRDFLLSPRRKARDLRDGTVLLFVCSFVCSFVCRQRVLVRHWPHWPITNSAIDWCWRPWAASKASPRHTDGGGGLSHRPLRPHWRCDQCLCSIIYEILALFMSYVTASDLWTIPRFAYDV